MVLPGPPYCGVIARFIVTLTVVLACDPLVLPIAVSVYVPAGVGGDMTQLALVAQLVAAPVVSAVSMPRNCPPLPFQLSCISSDAWKPCTCSWKGCPFATLAAAV